MFLPRNDEAIVDIAKLRDYCLNPSHPRGKHKAVVFASALGLTAEDAERLRSMILEAAKTDQAILTEKDVYGQRYQLDFAVVGLHGVVAIRTAWIVLSGETVPRLVTCFMH